MDALNRYPNLAAYNADVEAARNAYAADQAVADGLCAVCQRRVKKGSRHRRCWQCQQEGAREAGVIPRCSLCNHDHLGFACTAPVGVAGRHCGCLGEWATGASA